MSYELTLEQHYDDRMMLCFTQRPATIDAMFRSTVEKMPRQIALVFASERLTYAELAQRVDAVVAHLQQRGIGHGDRVALLIGNRPIFVFALLAILRIGAICVPMNTRQRQPEITYMASQSGACAILFDEGCATELPDNVSVPSVHSWFRADAQSNLRLDTRSHAAPQPSAQRASGEEDVCCIIYTSGTTGQPKGATLTNFGLLHSTLHYEHSLQLRADDIAMLAVPATHVWSQSFSRCCASADAP
jgi:acyl-CoA synthetase (AMP-forming)/AMP-acid ligase II